MHLTGTKIRSDDRVSPIRKTLFVLCTTLTYNQLEEPPGQYSRVYKIDSCLSSTTRIPIRLKDLKKKKKKRKSPTGWIKWPLKET